jgi:Fe2+ or Zn2+ uptake regulation protein
VTVSHHTPPIAASSVASAVAALRKRGLRVSSARRLVLEALFAADKPITAEEIAAGLEGWLPPSDLTSVYRNLDTLEQVGLIRHVHLGHGPGLYTLAAADDVEFAMCESCGAFETVEPARLDAARDLIEQELGYRARFSHFPIVGTCAKCRAAGPDTPSQEHHAHP